MISPLLLLAMLQAAAQVTPELRQHVEAGLKAKAAGDLDAAAREFGRVAQLAPQMAAAHVNLGAVLYEKRDYAGAIPPLRRALDLNPGLPGARGMLGAALLARGYAREAIPLLESSQSNDLLGVALLEAGRPRDALDRLEAALAARPGDPDLLYYLGQAHGQLSRQTFEKLKMAGAGSARAEQMLGEAAMAAGQREAAEKHLRAALAARPDLRGIHYLVGELYLAAGDYEAAEKEFRFEAELAPGNAAAAYKLGFTLQNLGRTKEGLAELQRADILQPGMPETDLELGKALAATGDLAAAEKRFQAVVKAEEKSALAAAAHRHLAQLYQKQGRDAEAEHELKLLQALRSAPK